MTVNATSTFGAPWSVPRFLVIFTAATESSSWYSMNACMLDPWRPVDPCGGLWPVSDIQSLSSAIVSWRRRHDSGKETGNGDWTLSRHKEQTF